MQTSERPAGANAADALVIIPAFNEERNLGAVLERLNLASPSTAVLVVNDGSTDGTSALARAHGACVVEHPFNLGYGSALQTGYKYAAAGGFSYLVQMDADGQHDPRDVARLLAPLREGRAEVCLGSRFAEGGQFHMGHVRSFGRACLQFLLHICGGPRVADPTSGFQAYSRSVFEFCCGEFYPTDFPDVDVLLMLHRQGFRIVEVPVTMAPNPASRVPMHSGLRVVYYSYKMLLATLRSALAPKQPFGLRG